MYLKYLEKGGPKIFSVTLVFLLLFTVFQVWTSFWLREWSADVLHGNHTNYESSVQYRVGIYGALGAAQSNYNDLFFQCGY